jgi:hypothetical protein
MVRLAIERDMRVESLSSKGSSVQPSTTLLPPAAGNCDDSAVRCKQTARVNFEETQYASFHRRLPVR